MFSLDIRLIKQLNGAILFFLAITIIGTFISLRNLSQNIPLTQIIPGKDKAGASGSEYKLQELKPFSYYSDIFSRRLLFKIIASAPGQQEKPKAASAAAALDRLKNYSLLGVVSGENPQAIIEDKKTKQTLYLQKGQSLEGFKITAVRDGKVILETDGQTAELSI